MYFKNYKLSKNEPTKIYIDNKSEIALAKNPSFHKSSKHINTRYHFIRAHVKEKQIELVSIKSPRRVWYFYEAIEAYEVFALLQEQLGMTRSSLREDVKN